MDRLSDCGKSLENHAPTHRIKATIKDGSMRRLRTLKQVVVLGLVSAIAAPAVALPPPPSAPFTLWNFLGIPQGLNKIRDASSNRRGNFPGMERKPPLKALADPKNLESKTPAIKKAAEIKTAEDEAPQKIKAIKYLATVGCGCYNEDGQITEAFLAALDDCTEEVRYQTVLAIEDASTMHCETCNQNCCCNEDLTKKLAQIAYERNDKGCWLEPSERVREAAKRAMCACCPGQGPIGEEVQSQTDNDREVIPTPAVPTPESVEDPSASHPGAGKPELITAERVQQALTSTRLPSTGAAMSEAVETEEVVTIDFGNGPASERVSSTRRSTSQDNVVARPEPTQPSNNAKTFRPASKRTVTPNAKGPSSRRSAAARGLSTTNREETAAAEPLPARSTLERTPVVQTTGSLTRLPDARVAYATDLPRRAGNLLAPKAVPTPPSPQVVMKDVAAGSKDGMRDVRGTVARVSKDAGTVEFRLERAGDLLNAGDRLQVKHSFLFGEGEALGLIEVISTGERGVIGRPVGKLTVDRISRGDEVRLYVPPRTAQAEKPVAKQNEAASSRREIATR
jgi:hypothetical protein